ncbi:peptidoglycan-binding domain-containing protein [Microbacterium sp.]|uniref:peptidoglycan-binding domain-containing protein n=1 Tax=Microbacterium sp. TaxID=51671 RepID=UPI003F988C85
MDSGETVDAGAVITEVNGRPVFAVASSFEFYRDVSVGDTGPDVKALQNALAARGYNVSVDGEFGAVTEQAVRAWYKDSGYVVPTRPAAAPDDPGQPDDKAIGPIPDQEVTSAVAVVVPRSEILGLTSLPISVIEGIAVGDRTGEDGGSDMIVGTPEKIVSVVAEPSQLSSVEVGGEVTIVIGGAEVVGRVDSIAAPAANDATKGDQADGNQTEPSSSLGTMTVVSQDVPSIDAALGTTARVLITKAIVPSESLLVPVIAVTDRGGENTIVMVRRDDGVFVEVPVVVLGTLDGQAAIEPVESGAVSVGDELKVG